MSDYYIKKASELFNIKEDEVTTEMREKVKMLDLGNIYGLNANKNN